MPNTSTILLFMVVVGAAGYCMYTSQPVPVKKPERGTDLEDPSDFSRIPLSLWDPHNTPIPGSSGWAYNHDRS